MYCVSQAGLKLGDLKPGADLLDGADGDTCRTGHYEMTVLDVWPDLIQNKRNDVRFYSQKEHIALIDSLFVASCQVHPHFLQKGTGERSGDDRGDTDASISLPITQETRKLLFSPSALSQWAGLCLGSWL